MTATYTPCRPPFTAESRAAERLVASLAVRESLGVVAVLWYRTGDADPRTPDGRSFPDPVLGWVNRNRWLPGSGWVEPPALALVADRDDQVSTAAHEVHHLVQMRRGYPFTGPIAEQEAEDYAGNLLGTLRSRTHRGVVQDPETVEREARGDLARLFLDVAELAGVVPVDTGARDQDLALVIAERLVRGDWARVPDDVRPMLRRLAGQVIGTQRAARP